MAHDRSTSRLWIGLIPIAVVAGLWFLGPRPVPIPTASAYTFPALQTVELQVGEKQMQELERRRAKALEAGVLQEEAGSWVKAVLVEGDRKWKVDIRLKGDWTDHLEGRKWSFRVEVKDNDAWRRLREFSLLSPERRGYLDEWVFHRALAQVDVLTPRYDFIYLRLNGENLGTYAVEEHFTPELLRNQGRVRGPILKFDETGMWDARVEALRDSSFPYLQIPFQVAADVRPFQPRRTLRDSTRSLQFELANRLMWQYRSGTAPPAELFDLDRMARYYALMDIFGAYHSLIWHNRRYYYNPVTSRLEPVVFDAFSGEGNDAYSATPFWGYGVDGYRFHGDYHDVVSDVFFRDAGFVRTYHGYLRQYSEPGFLDGLLGGLEKEVREREVFLRMEYWGYRYDLRRVEARAGRLRDQDYPNYPTR